MELIALAEIRLRPIPFTFFPTFYFFKFMHPIVYRTLIDQMEIIKPLIGLNFNIL